MLNIIAKLREADLSKTARGLAALSKLAIPVGFWSDFDRFCWGAETPKTKMPRWREASWIFESAA
jgi:hypothetical protein